MTLYEHQKEAIKKMKNGCILCGGCGTGKSLTALAYFFKNELKTSIEPDIQSPKINKDLYIITTAKKRNDGEWENELNRFLLSTKKGESYGGINCVVDSWNNIAKYKDIKNAFFIFDEQRVVGYGLWAKTFIEISRNNNWILLSATPGDTWMDYIPVFIANGFYKNKSDFEKRHVMYSRFTRFPSVYKYFDVDRLINLKKSILVYMPCAKNTTTHDETIFCGYDKDLYHKVIKNRWNPFKNKPIKSSTELTYILRRVVNSNNADRNIAILGLAESHPKIIIFYNFYYELDELKDIFQNTDFAVAELNGKKHDPIPKTEKWAYLVQYNAGCEGWNCIETDTIIFYSIQPSWKKQKQAEGRIDRINTPFTDLYYYKLMSDSSIDKRILVCLNTKQKFNSRDFAETMGVYDFNE